MIYFTSDLHFSHGNVIKHANRPFMNADEMDNALIRNWNKIVTSEDEVYVLGDFTMKGSEIATDMICSLNGKIHMVRGNHDKFLDSKGFDKSLFIEVVQYKELVYKNMRFILFHYPILEWNHYFRNAIHLHGHQHNHKEYNLENKKNGLLRYDVGVDANDFKPVSIDDVIKFFD